MSVVSCKTRSAEDRDFCVMFYFFLLRLVGLSLARLSAVGRRRAERVVTSWFVKRVVTS